MPKKHSHFFEVCKPTERQQQFFAVAKDHDFILYGGAAGGGKSYLLRWSLVWFLLACRDLGLKNVQTGLFCEDYPSLHDRQISKIRYEFPEWLGTLKTGGDSKQFQLAEQYGGGIIAFRNLDDPSKYLSAEFAAIGVDELTKNTKDVFDFLRLRLRWPGIEHPRFFGASNPGGKGHQWVKSLWIDRKFPPELEPLAEQFAFVPALATDNPHLADSYWIQLNTLPTAMRQAYVQGRWDVFAGQYFDIFSPFEHVKPPQEFNLKPWHPRWVGIDWGFGHPAAVYWNAQDGAVTKTYREFIQAQLSPIKLAEKIVELSSEDKTHDGHTLIDQIWMGPDAFAHHTDAETIADQMNRVFMECGFPQASPADTDRVGGATLMYDLLRTGKWLIGSNCTGLIEILPVMTRDEKKVEDVIKFDASGTNPGDDAYDSVRYALKSRLSPGRPPAEVRIAERTEGIENMSQRMLAIQRFEGDERAKDRRSVPARSHWATNRWKDREKEYA